MIPIILASLVAIGALGTTIWQEKEKAKSDKKADEYQRKSEEFQKLAQENQEKADEYFDKLILASEENARLSKKINTKAEDIIKSNNNLIHSQSEIIKQIMGSGHAILDINPGVQNKLSFLIRNNGSYPLNNLVIQVINYNEIVKKYKVVANERNKVNINLDFYMSKFLYSSAPSERNLSPKSVVRIIDNQIPIEGKYYFLTIIHSLNKNTFQYSIVECFPMQSATKHSYKIFEITADESYKLIEENTNGLPNSEWENNFHFKRTINLTTAEN